MRLDALPIGARFVVPGVGPHQRGQLIALGPMGAKVRWDRRATVAFDAQGNQIRFQAAYEIEIISAGTEVEPCEEDG
jgi:hypothetical protein